MISASLLPALDAFLETMDHVQCLRLQEDAAEDKRKRALLLQQLTAQQLAELAQRLADENDDFSEEDFVDASSKHLGAAYLAGFLLAATRTSRGRADTWVAEAVDKQTPYLKGFAADVAKAAKEPPPASADVGALGTMLGSMSLDSVEARAALYAGPIWSGFQRGQVDNEDNFKFIWHAHPEDTKTGESCELCDARDGEEFDQDSLPGFPGEGDFGEICEGAGACHCEVEILGGSE